MASRSLLTRLSHLSLSPAFSRTSASLHTSAILRQASAVDAPSETKKQEWTTASIRTGVLARKKGMTCMWDEWGQRIPVTVLQLDNVQVTDTRTAEKHGYTALQIGCSNRKPKNITKPMLGHYAKVQVPPKMKVAEFRVTPDAMLPVGTQISAAHFVAGQYVDVAAPSLGKGFQGVMKRHGFKGQQASHGVSLAHRSLGSTGQRTDPARVFKGKKMPGRMGGNKQVTVQNLKVMKVDTELNLLLVKGAVPGFDDQFVRIQDAIKLRTSGKAFPPESSVPFPTASEELIRSIGREAVAKTGGRDPFAVKE
ncbi:mitochondrial 54S ribosomal protein uL3m [Calcarisporiella thermophila]|uniref:mitochondrial 54S ribosomal protein uL3m n=1 Tax=Calcarisporiella thermophila TaxID=911321 RepID=UPI003743B4B1